MTKVKRNHAFMTSHHFELEPSPIQFLRARDHFREQTGADPGAPAFGLNVKLLQPTDDPAMFNAEMRCGISHASGRAVLDCKQDKAFRRVGNDLSRNITKVSQPAADIVLAELRFKKSDGVLQVRKCNGLDRDGGHDGSGLPN